MKANLINWSKEMDGMDLLVNLILSKIQKFIFFFLSVNVNMINRILVITSKKIP